MFLSVLARSGQLFTSSVAVPFALEFLFVLTDTCAKRLSPAFSAGEMRTILVARHKPQGTARGHFVELA
jgi:hypothetical protein